jgi:CPA2 family monovalent cation:H+ antiporter-2
MDPHQFLETLAIVLCTAAVTTVLFQRFKQPVVLGYLLAGMLISPHIPVPVEADRNIVATLSELGVILLLFSLGIEFSFRKLLRVGPTAGLIALVQCSLMVWLGYLTGQAFGWTQLESLYAGAIIAISSTTIIVKAFEEQRIKDDFAEVVFGVLIVEDLIGILLITILTTLSAGEELSTVELARVAGKLSTFLLVLIVVGLLVVPRLMRAVVALDRPETTVVASCGLAFGFALIAYLFDYSVALGAFIAGSLVGESGVEKTVEHLIQPVRDLFAAIFFVSVGMLIDPALIVAYWPAVLVFLVVVVLGKVFSVTLGAFLTGQSVHTSVKSGMSLAQIGEFSFIIAGVGLATGAVGDFLYPIAVAVSGATTLLTPWLIRAAEPAATFVDRKLPRPLQTFVALYGSWVEQLRTGSPREGDVTRIRGLMRWLAVDAVVVTAIIIAASIEMDRLSALATEHLGLSNAAARLMIIAIGAAMSAPFWIGMIRVTRFLGQELAARALPAAQGKPDTADAPRRLLVVTLQLAIVILVGAPLLAITQPFVPPLQGAVILVLLLGLLATIFWRRATNLQGHTKAAAQVIAEALAQRTREGRASAIDGKADGAGEVDAMLVGLGTPTPIQLPPESTAVGKTLAELNLRGLTGATVLAVKRANETVLVPAGRERLAAGDVLALAGTKEALEDARFLLLGAESTSAEQIGLHADESQVS